MRRALLLILAFTLLFSSAYGGEELSPEFKRERELILSSMESELAEIISKLRDDTIIGIELVIAGATKINGIQSRFGHSLLRFIDQDETWSTDHLLGFVADVDEPKLSYMKGIFGGYNIIVEPKRLGDFWMKYVLGQSRALERYIIPTAPHHRLKMADILEEFLIMWKRMGLSTFKRYKFITRNCSQVLGHFLRAAGIIMKRSTIAMVPVKSAKKLARELLNPYPALTIPSVYPTLLKSVQTLEMSDIGDLYDQEKWPENSVQLLEKNLSDLEIKQLLGSYINAPFKIKMQLIRGHNYRDKTKASFDQVMGVVTAPHVLYELCMKDDLECGAEVQESLRSVWDANTLLEDQLEKLKRAKRLSRRRRVNQEYLDHFMIMQ